MQQMQHLVWSDQIRGQPPPPGLSDRRPAPARPLGFRLFFETAWLSPRHASPPAHLSTSASSSAHMRHIQLARASRTILEARTLSLLPPATGSQTIACIYILLYKTSVRPVRLDPNTQAMPLHVCASRPRHPSAPTRVRATGNIITPRVGNGGKREYCGLVQDPLYRVHMHEIAQKQTHGRLCLSTRAHQWWTASG